MTASTDGGRRRRRPTRSADVVGRRITRRRRIPVAPGLDLTPMVDVVFLLIIFFMVSTTFITLESGLPVDLPQAQSAQAQPSDLPTVTVTRESRVFLARRRGGARPTSWSLLQEAMQASGQTTVVLRADETVAHGFVVEIMDLIRLAGAQRIAIATGG
jgi:biopolymer transport protein ExbD